MDYFLILEQNMLKMIIQVVIIVIGVFPSIFMRLNSHLDYQNAVICSINNFLGIEHISSINKKLYFAGVAETLYSVFYSGSDKYVCY